MTKPFNVGELLARIRAVSPRRGPFEVAPPVQIGQFTVDLEARTVTRTDDPAQAVHLTRTEWQLLDLFARNPGKLISQR